MKNTRFFICCFVLLNIFAAHAQLGNNSMRNHKSQPEIEAEKKAREREFELDKAKAMEEAINNMKDELQLDELQLIGIKQIFSESTKSQGVILKKDMPQDQKREMLTAIAKTADIKVKALLNPEQVKKYDLYRENPDAFRKKKKEKSKK